MAPKRARSQHGQPPEKGARALQRRRPAGAAATADTAATAQTAATADTEATADAAGAADAAATFKDFRSAVDESIDEFLCPITQALPLDPVIAEDGKVYERAAVAEWLEKNRRSPVTNLEMGPTLLPATHIRNMIERLVRSGVLAGEKAAGWSRLIKEQEELAEVRRAAEAGKLGAMVKLAGWYATGEKGLDEDATEALSLFQKAAEAGSPSAMGVLAGKYYHGSGVLRQMGLALRWAAAASVLRDGQGMRVLGRLYMDGAAELPVDKEGGFKLYLKGLESAPGSAGGWFNLGKWYEEGTGTPVDLKRAADAMRRAAALTRPRAEVERARAWLAERGLQQ